MAEHFTDAEWQAVEAGLGDGQAYGMPNRTPESVIFGCWNIRKFGAVQGRDGTPSRSAGALRLIENFAGRCDLLAIQEVQSDLGSVRLLRDRLNAARPGAQYRVIASDVTGLVPGYTGMAERFAFIFDAARVEIGEIASDLTLDQTAVLSNVNAAIIETHNAVLAEDPETTLAERAINWMRNFTGFQGGKLPRFFQFIRSPHMVTFKVHGVDDQSYELACVNAHLLSGKPIEREREFFALLEWLYRRASGDGSLDAPVTLLMADLNLSFDNDNETRRNVIEEFVVGLNQRRSSAAKINFPFLDIHPVRGEIRTNSRKAETFDHIAFFSRDERFPRARHNGEAGSASADHFDYGMFDFVRLFEEVGVVSAPDGGIAYEKFEHDVSDHMPIWLRMPAPRRGQRRYVVDA